MAEKRKAIFTFLLKNHGKKKTNKIELFESALFKQKDYWSRTKQYRIRVNGKWFPKGKAQFFYKTQIRNMIFRSLKIQ
jgi:hypothetical protein